MLRDEPGGDVRGDKELGLHSSHTPIFHARHTKHVGEGMAAAALAEAEEEAEEEDVEGRGFVFASVDVAIAARASLIHPIPAASITLRFTSRAVLTSVSPIVSAISTIAKARGSLP